MEKQLRLHPHYLEDGKIDRVFERVKNAAKQEALILGYLSDNPKGSGNPHSTCEKNGVALQQLFNSL